MYSIDINKKKQVIGRKILTKIKERVKLWNHLLMFLSQIIYYITL